MRGNYKKDKGYALMTVLIFFTVLLIIGLGLGYITQKGYLSVSAEAKFAKAEKLANMGLLKVVESETCPDSIYQASDKGTFNVTARPDSDHKNCLVWSEGKYKGARVVKTAVFPLFGLNWGAGVFKKLNNLSLGGNAAIVGYDFPENYCNDTDPCAVAPALVTGNNLGLRYNSTSCDPHPNPNNLGSGLISTVTPYQNDTSLLNKDLTNMLFNASNRTEMLGNFSEIFKVKFNNGKPDGIENPDLGPSQLGNINNCIANGNTITCDGSKNFVWNGTHYVYNSRGYQSIDFGQNAQIIIQGTFTGGGIIAGNQIKFQGNISSTSLITIARNQIDMTTDGINIKNTFMFAQNYNINAKRMTVENGIIYSGGEGVGNLNIDLNAQTSLGTQANPVLIITDNNINIQRNGNSEIWGVIFATEKNNNFNIGTGNGDFKIHGSIISNSLNNNNMNISGNFEMRFNFKTIEKLYRNLSDPNNPSGLKLNFLKKPECGASKGKLLKLTGMRVY